MKEYSKFHINFKYVKLNFIKLLSTTQKKTKKGMVVLHFNRLVVI